jgi:hypothetical protein
MPPRLLHTPVMQPVAAEAALLDEPHEPEPPPQQRSRRQLQPHGMVERESMPLSPVHSVGLLSAQAYRNQYQMTVDVRDAPDPCQTFEHADLPPALLGAVSAGDENDSSSKCTVSSSINSSNVSCSPHLFILPAPRPHLPRCHAANALHLAPRAAIPSSPLRARTAAQARFHGSDIHPGSGMADRASGSRSCCHSLNWLWQDGWFPSASIPPHPAAAG